MHRIILEIGGRPIYTYGVMMALGILAGVTVAWLLARREGQYQAQVLDSSVWLVVGGIVGARLAYILPRWEEYAGAPLALFAMWEGGLSIQGGLVGGLIAGVVFARLKRIPFFAFADLWAPGLLIGQALGRIGCYFNGCTFGVPTGGGWGSVYPAGSAAFERFGSQALYPTPLFEFGWDIGLFLLLLLLWRRRGFDGFIFLLYAAVWSMGYALIRFVRGDELSVAAGLTYGQFGGFLAAGLAVALMVVLRMRKRQADKAAKRVENGLPLADTTVSSS